MNIKKLESENVKRIKVVEITPDGNTIIVGGDNAQGKSSVLDSIFMALGGKSAQGHRPVRDGEEKAIIKCDLGELVVTRTIRANGNTAVKVQNSDGAVFQSPQAMLDALSTKLTFDPLAFANDKPAVQLDTLKGLVGLDFTKDDKKRAEIYSQRAAVNKNGKQAAAQFDAMTYDDLAPTEPVSASALMEELSAAEATNAANAEKRKAVDDLAVEIKETHEKIASLQDGLLALQRSHNDASAVKANLTEIDTESIRTQISEADTKNAALRANAEYEKTKSAVEDLRKKSAKFSADIKAIDKAKSDAMAGAEFPVDGLSFDETGVTFNGMPFDQCSSSERLIVSLNMGIAMNPKLNVLLIRDGSLLDENSLSIVSEQAEKAGAQVWIERVSKGSECSVIIEDGMVVGE